MNTEKKFVCENWRPGEVCHPHKHIPTWERLCVAVLGASLVTAPPIINRFAVETAEGFEAISNVVFGGAAVFTLAWVLSVLMTVRMDEDHVVKYLLMSVGLPGFVASMALVGQLPIP